VPTSDACGGADTEERTALGVMKTRAAAAPELVSCQGCRCMDDRLEAVMELEDLTGQR
jgi:hypothetical protein